MLTLIKREVLQLTYAYIRSVKCVPLLSLVSTILIKDQVRLKKHRTKYSATCSTVLRQLMLHHWSYTSAVCVVCSLLNARNGGDQKKNHFAEKIKEIFKDKWHFSWVLQSCRHQCIHGISLREIWECQISLKKSGSTLCTENRQILYCGCSGEYPERILNKGTELQMMTERFSIAWKLIDMTIILGKTVATTCSTITK